MPAVGSWNSGRMAPWGFLRNLVLILCTSWSASGNHSGETKGFSASRSTWSSRTRDAEKINYPHSSSYLLLSPEDSFQEGNKWSRGVNQRRGLRTPVPKPRAQFGSCPCFSNFALSWAWWKWPQSPRRDFIGCLFQSDFTEGFQRG